jgi:hypothetical protein
MPVGRRPERSTEQYEGPDASRRFESTLKRIVSVPKAELVKREAAYQKARRGKKTRTTGTR